MKTIMIIASVIHTLLLMAQHPSRYEFIIEGMTCDNCAKTNMHALSALKGVTSASVDYPTKKAVVETDGTASPDAIREAVAKNGFEALLEGDTHITPLSESGKAGLDLLDIKSGKKIRIKEHLAPGKITAFDFYADWCGPCRLLSPKIERLLLKYPSMALRKVDILSWKSDLSKQLSSEYRMPSIPFVLMFDETGKLLGRVEGNHIDQIEQIIIDNVK